MSAPDTKTKPPAPPAPEAAGDGFLSRWSRRKRAAEAGQPLPEPAPPTPAAAPQAAPAEVELPDPATLSFDDDFTRYLGTQVPAALKRAAMARLFAEPCFNQMDGLDVYIEDYNLVPDLPAAERDLLAHAREVLNPTPPAGGELAPSGDAARAAEPPPPTADAGLPAEPPSAPQAVARMEIPAADAPLRRSFVPAPDSIQENAVAAASTTAVPSSQSLLPVGEGGKAPLPPGEGLG